MKILQRATILALSALTAASLLTGCGEKENTVGQEKTNISYAKGSGPYSELFEEAIIPILEKKGYTFECVELQLSEADVVINDGDVDLSVEQHTAYMDAFNDSAGGDLVALSRIPTVPASVFSNKHASVDEIADGMTVAIPQDAGNMARAMIMLQDLGWVKLKEGTSKATASPEDVEEYLYDIEIQELATNLIATTLDDFDYGIITGSIVAYSGLDPSTALFNENLSDEFWLQVVVKAENKDTQWAKDVVAAYQSEEFLNWIHENNGPKYNNLWSIPEY